MNRKVIFKDLTEVPALAPLILKWRNSPEVRAQMLRQHLISEEEHARWLETVSKAGASTFVRVAFWGDRPFGVVNLSDVDRAFSCALWGLYIGEPDLRGRGLGKALLAHLLFWGFEELSLYRLYASVLEKNTAAQVLYGKAGFRDEGVWKGHVLTERGRQDLLWVGMTAPEWPRYREKAKNWLL
ncbi:MAG: UDP-4-amino-4,6-dideoxy-N-acetyl-beta-L-altrosamine N-acetyltransferase [Fretibacterium sp.]|nr:UDP-4-amino-4,6-dideoxy-N-acetyl-beta-L-altrosamine N-acetyltransferase [Fretibacterium sp.]